MKPRRIKPDPDPLWQETNTEDGDARPNVCIDVETGEVAPMCYAKNNCVAAGLPLVKCVSASCQRYLHQMCSKHRLNKKSTDIAN